MTALNTKSRAASVTIGKLSESTGVNIETIRYYERIGLLPAPPRSAGRHRLYENQHRQRLAFIRRARELGFSLDQVRVLLALSGAHGLACDEVKAITDEHITEVRRKVRDLRKLERILTELVARCQPNSVPDCPILEALSETR
jgi:MerR family mercuric resistance operon transcriptional regulator